MKKVKWSCILFALSLLTGCSSDASIPSKQEEQEAMYDLSVYESSVPTAFSFVSNGTAAAAISMDGSVDYTGQIFDLDFGETVDAVPALKFSDYTDVDLLGLDADGGYWVCGDANDECFLLHTDAQGELLLRVNLNEQGDIYAVRSFASDQQYIYLTVECAKESPLGVRGLYDALYVYTLEGEFVTSKYFEEIKEATIGYLDVEEDWMEDMEGLSAYPEELFGSQVKDRYQFVTLSDRQVGLIIERRSPIGTESYYIICTLEPGTLEVTPQFSYEVDVLATEAYNFPISGAGTDYDLLMWEPDGIFGVDLTQKDYQLIQPWDTLGGDVEISIDNLYQSAVGFSDGRLLFEFGNGYTHQYFFAVLTPQTAMDQNFGG
jgi:hypothetical protein